MDQLKLVLIADQWNWSAFRVLNGVSQHSKHISMVTCFEPPRNQEDFDVLYYRYGALASKHVDRIKNSTKKWIAGISGFGCLTRCTKPQRKEFSDFIYEFDALTANSLQMKKILNEIDSSMPVYLCHSGYDERLFKPSPFPEEFHIGWAGKANAGKGHKSFLQLPFSQRASAVGCGTGRPHYEMPDYYKTISVYVSTSIREGSPLPPKEAAGSGRPVVAVSAGDMPEWFPPKWIVENTGKDSYKALIPLIEELQDPDMLHKIGMEFHEAVQPYEFSRLVREYDTMFESVCYD